MLQLTITIELNSACDPEEVINQLDAYNVFDYLRAITTHTENMVDDEVDPAAVREITALGVTDNTDFINYFKRITYSPPR